MTSSTIEFPKQFNILYNEPNFDRYIKFALYREPDISTWNGYYKECRIRLWYTGEFWIVAGYVSGVQACYFRNIAAECTLKMINKLVQCTCYYIDTITKIEE